MNGSLTISDRQSALAFLYDRIDYERMPSAAYASRPFKLDRMRTLLARLGNPQERLDIVHIAGTKGKGSTAAMIASVLTAAGYRTGLYTSPHLDRMEQRMMVQGHPCSGPELVELVALVEPVVGEMDREASRSGQTESGPTYFEITTALALMHFARRAVDMAVLEVGLGGRLDSTNICRPRVSVITSISLDHTDLLGHSLGEIAAEKAGIIKPGIPVVSGVTQPDPRSTIQQICHRHGCVLVQRGTDFDVRYRAPAPARDGLPAGPGRFDYLEPPPRTVPGLEDIQLGLLGRHQAANAAVAVATLRQLQQNRWHLSEADLRAGLAEVTSPARVEIVSRSPGIVVDAAHNVASIAALVRVLDESFAPRHRLLVFATSQDKDAEGMLRELLPHFDRVILTRYQNNPRGVDPQELANTVGQLAAQTGWHGNVFSADGMMICPDPVTAWQAARAQSHSGSLVCVTGSFFIAAEMRRCIQADEVPVGDEFITA